MPSVNLVLKKLLNCNIEAYDSQWQKAKHYDITVIANGSKVIRVKVIHRKINSSTNGTILMDNSPLLPDYYVIRVDDTDNNTDTFLVLSPQDIQKESAPASLALSTKTKIAEKLVPYQNQWGSIK
jgi:hypothetical protein